MARLILTEPGEDVDVGGNVTVFGTGAIGEVITILRGDIVLDPSFNVGGDIIRLPDIASSFTVRLAGSIVILTGPTTTVSIPIGTAGLQIEFDDDSRTLLIDTAANQPKLGTQTITANDVGVLPVGATGQLIGTEGADTINGSSGGDAIDGLGGNDVINGLAGDDFIRGGGGDDTLTGGLGDDEISGGAGNDRIIDNEGAFAGLDGGIGNDRISVNNLLLTSATVDGGEGDDTIELTLGTTGIAFVTAGSGADRVVIDSDGFEVNLQLGAGRDELVLPSGALGTGSFGFIVVEDFEVGAAGDKVDLGAALASYLQNYTAGSNPFASGHLRLVDTFGNAYLQVDRDGPTGSGQFKDLINFAGTDKDSLTAENFGGFDTRASVAAISAVAMASPAAATDFALHHGSSDADLAVMPDVRLAPLASYDSFYFLA